MTRDHVWPRGLQLSDQRRAAAERYGLLRWRMEGNCLLAHGRCNAARANAPPTGCQIIMLTVVNVRLGIEERGDWPRPTR